VGTVPTPLVVDTILAYRTFGTVFVEITVVAETAYRTEYLVFAALDTLSERVKVIAALAAVLTVTAIPTPQLAVILQAVLTVAAPVTVVETMLVDVTFRTQPAVGADFGVFFANGTFSFGGTFTAFLAPLADVAPVHAFIF
jgi:hypothetical protein